MPDDEIRWNVAAREASGRGFRTLTGDQERLHQSLREQLGGESPLPYPEFAVPHRDFIDALLGGSEERAADLLRAGDGQALMAARDADAETANGG